MPKAEKLCDLSAPSGNEATAPGGIESRLVPRSPRVVSIGQAPTIDGCRFGSQGLFRRTPRSLNSVATPRPTQRRRTASFLCSLTTADRVPHPPLFQLRPVVAKRGVNVVVKAKGEQLDRTTGYIGKDNSGNGNIFAIEPRQLYTESPTSDKFAKQGLGGIPGVILAIGILAGVFFATQTLGTFEDKNNEYANFKGQPLTYYIDAFSK